MEQNPTVLPKKVWNLVRVVYFMLRKGISKKKLLLEINMMIKRGKIAGKALFHHHHHNREILSTNHLSFTSPEAAGEYEFSCSNSPSSTTTKHHPFSLFSHHKKHDHHSNINLPSKDHLLDMMAVEAVLKAMEMIHSNNSSPALPGFGNTPLVRQLRITDSPFPLMSSSVDENNHVDEKAEQFISRFYNDLRQQNTTAYRI